MEFDTVEMTDQIVTILKRASPEQLAGVGHGLGMYLGQLSLHGSEVEKKIINRFAKGLKAGVEDAKE